MRKILLATTAIVGFAAAGAAQAANSPLNVTVGGSVDFVAGASRESKSSGATNTTGGDFETIYSLSFGVTGKAANGIEYGADLVLDNDIDSTELVGGGDIDVTKAIVHMSGAFGKVQLGDARGATDLAVGAPVVAGIRYIDFLGAGNFAKDLVVGVDSLDHSTNVTYYTPKVGNDMHKVQAAVSYVPQQQSGSNVALVGNSDYRNTIKGAVAYNGSINNVAVNASAHMISAATSSAPAVLRDFTSWGLGAQAAYQGFTLGANYTDNGHYNTVVTETKNQQTYAVGLTYELNKVAVGVDYLNAKGYSDAAFANGYVKTFNKYGVGGTYTWAPGLTTTVNGVLFNQKTQAGVENDGYVLLVSQKLAF